MQTIMFYINTISGGGAERVIVGLANDCARRGNRVLMVATMRGNNEYELDPKVERFTLEEEMPSKSRIKKNIDRVLGLRKLIKKYEPSLLVSFMAEPNFRSVLAATGLSAKVIVSVRNDPSIEYSGRVGRFLGRHWITRADGCVFQTPDAKDWFPEAFKARSAVIPNSVGRQFLETQCCPIENPHGGKDIVTAGRLCTQKNQRMLIDAFARIMDKHAGDRLLIYGHGPLDDELAEHIKKVGATDQVVLMGRSNKMEEALSRAAVFVLSSDYEGMPNALIEAMAVGMPCISTDCPCGGPRMLIEHGSDGLLVPVGDVEAMSQAMDYMLSNYDIAIRMGEAAKERAMSLSPDIIFDRWNEYYDEVLHVAI